MFQVFQMYAAYVLSGCWKSRFGVAYIAMTIHVCCKCMFQMFWLFKRMLRVLYLNVAYVALTIHICCKCMFQMFQLFQMYVASVLSGCCICCSAHTHMLQAYVINVLSISDVCCIKCFTLQVLHQPTQLRGTGRGGPRVRAGSQAGMTIGAEHKAMSINNNS
jgi:hypothetical protein